MNIPTYKSAFGWGSYFDMTCLHPSVNWRADRVRVSAPRTKNLIAASSCIDWKILGVKLPIISRVSRILFQLGELILVLD